MPRLEPTLNWKYSYKNLHEEYEQPFNPVEFTYTSRDRHRPHLPNAHATINGNSARHIAASCPATLSLITTSAAASRSAAAHRAALSRKNGSSVPATRYVRGNGVG